MRLTRLVLDDFLSYEHTDLDLTGVSQVVAVGPVGAGKSTLIEAVRWALWGEVRVATLDSVVREGADLAQVRVEFTTGGHEVAVTRTKARGRDSTLTLEVNGELATRHTLRETMAEVRQIVGLSHEAALAGPLMLQGDAGALMRLSPSARKEVLLGLFGLERFEALEAAAKAKRDDAQMTMRSDQSMIDALGSPVTDMTLYEAQIADLQPKQETLDEAVAFGRERIATLTASTAALRERTGRGVAVQTELEVVRTEFRAKQEQMHLAAAAAIAADNALTALRKEPVVKPTTIIEQVEQVSAKAVREHATVFADLEAKRRELAAIDKQAEVKCPQCGKVFRPDVDEVHVAELTTAVEVLVAGEASLKALADEAARGLAQVRVAHHAYADYERNVAVSEGHLNQMKERVAGLTPQVKGLSERGKKLRDELAGLEAAGPELTAALEELDSARIAFEANDKALAETETELLRLGMLIEKCKQAIERRAFLEKERDAAQGNYQTHDWLAKAFHRDGIPTLMLESGLPTIEARTNDVLDRMPGGFKVRLSTQRATQTGKMQERLDVVVEVGGSEREYAALSGGQQFRVDLALRMGLTAALSNRTFDTLIADEALDRFQDDAGREALLESVAAIADDFGLIFVASHHPSVIERFANRIEVNMDDDRVSSAVLS